MLICYTVYDNDDSKLIRKVPINTLTEWYAAAQLAGLKITSDKNLGIERMTITYYSSDGVVVSRAEGEFEGQERAFTMFAWDEANPPIGLSH